MNRGESRNGIGCEGSRSRPDPLGSRPVHHLFWVGPLSGLVMGLFFLGLFGLNLWTGLGFVVLPAVPLGIAWHSLARMRKTNVREFVRPLQH